MSIAFSSVYVEHVLDPGYRNWKRLYYGDLLAVHKAHLIMLQETGIVSRTAAAAIKASMAAIEAGTAFPDHLPEGLEDLFFFYEKELDRHGAGRSASLHTARSRNDMDTTVFRLALKRELRDLVGRLTSCARTILQRARAGESELTILSTHGQPANVSTMAHYLSAFLLDFLEGTESLVTAMGSTDRCSLGACAITGTGFAIRPRPHLASPGFQLSRPQQLPGHRDVALADQSRAGAAAHPLRHGAPCRRYDSQGSRRSGALRVPRRSCADKQHHAAKAQPGDP